MRDRILLDMADEASLEEDPEMRRTMALWRDKWLFQEYRALRRGRHAVTGEEVRRFYEREDARRDGALSPYASLDAAQRERLRAQLEQERIRALVDSLAGAYRIEIDETMPDTLTITPSADHSTMTVHLLKNNSNKMPYPIVDPNWRVDP